MRSTTKVIATGALALFLMPALHLNAAGAATPGATVVADKASESSSAAAAPSASMGSGVSNPDGTSAPRFDVALVYSYVRAVPTDAAGNRMVWLNGGSASINFHLNRTIGIVGDFGGYADSRLRFGTSSSALVSDSSGKAFTYLFGPRATFASHKRLSPFAQVLVGGIHASPVTLSSGCSGVGCTPLPAENKLAMTAGGGLDLRLHRHISVRIIQAEYLMTRFNDLSTGSTGTQNDMRLSSGLVFRFGGSHASSARVEPAAAAPLDYSCSVTPSSVFAGEPIAVSGTSTNLSATRPAVYAWSSDGGVTSGNSNQARIDTTGVKPGTYTVKGHVSDGSDADRSADCAASYEVKAFDPPTVSCSAYPSLMAPSQSASITVVGASPQNRPLTYTYSASSGTVNGSASPAMLSTATTDSGAITVTCNVADDLGHTASATTTVTLMTPEVAVKPAATQLCSIHFDRDSKRPARVDNEAKACLDEIAMNLQKTPDATLAIVGDAANGERRGTALATERGKNAKAYLVADKGIDASRVKVYSGKQDGRMVSATLIPAGAEFDASGDTPIQ